MKRRCKDCPDTSKRPAPNPGPRCATHHRAVTRTRRKQAHDQRVQNVYGLGPGEYDAIYAAQGGRCAICQRATGATKRLAVDHDHTTGQIRGLACGPCNQYIGYVRDDPEAFLRAAAYLTRGNP